MDKYPDTLTKALHQIAEEGLSDASVYCPGENGEVYDLFIAPVYDVDREEATHEDLLPNYAGAIIYQDRYGFVSSSIFINREELDAEWAEIEAEEERELE